MNKLDLHIWCCNLVSNAVNFKQSTYYQSEYNINGGVLENVQDWQGGLEQLCTV